jgi:hypothetical protein
MMVRLELSRCMLLSENLLRLCFADFAKVIGEVRAFLSKESHIRGLPSASLPS